VPVARRISRWYALLLTGIAVAATATARASGPVDIALVQATGSAEEPLPRPTIGAGAPATPALPFRVALTHRCPAGTASTELFVSIADTARLVEAGPPGEPQVVTVEVPLRQLQWLDQPAATCNTVSARRRPDEVGQDGLEYFRLHAGTAGYATVTCRDEKGAPSSATTSAPLDVWLACATADGSPGAGPGADDAPGR
jgi:hypothetical protein